MPLIYNEPHVTERRIIVLENYLRSWYQKVFVDPLLKLLPNKQISANYYTLTGGILGICLVPVLQHGYVLIAIFLLLLSCYFDTLDGSVARLDQQQSALGCILDIVTDRIVEAAVILALYLVDPMNRGLLTIWMLGSMYICVTAFLVVSLFSSQLSEKGFSYSPGLIERAEAVLFFILMMLFPQWFSLLAIVFIILVLLTAFMHIYRFYCFEDPS